MHCNQNDLSIDYPRWLSRGKWDYIIPACLLSTINPDLLQYQIYSNGVKYHAPKPVVDRINLFESWGMDGASPTLWMEKIIREDITIPILLWTAFKKKFIRDYGYDSSLKVRYPAATAACLDPDIKISVDGSVIMAPHIKESNVAIRITQVTSLYNKICVYPPVRIDTGKIVDPVQLIDLAWLLAFCRRGYNSLSDVDFDDTELSAMAEDIRKNIVDSLHFSSRLIGLNPKYYDEVDVATGMTTQKAIDYPLPPDTVISFLSENTFFSRYLFDEKITPKVNDTNPHNNPPTTPSDNTAIDADQNDIRPSAKGSSRSEIIRLELELILDTSPPVNVNRNTLWKALLHRAGFSDSRFIKKHSALIAEKDTGVEWEREKANHHLDAVIEWYTARNPVKS